MKKLLGYFLAFNLIPLICVLIFLLFGVTNNDKLFISICPNNVYVAAYLLGVLFNIFIIVLTTFCSFIFILIHES